MVVIFLTVFFNVDMIPGKREINNAMFQWIKYSLIDITACDFEYSFKVTIKAEWMWLWFRKFLLYFLATGKKTASLTLCSSLR